MYKNCSDEYFLFLIVSYAESSAHIWILNTDFAMNMDFVGLKFSGFIVCQYSDGSFQSI